MATMTSDENAGTAGEATHRRPRTEESRPDAEKRRPRTSHKAKEQLDEELDEGLEESFPASDPPSSTQNPS